MAHTDGRVYRSGGATFVEMVGERYAYLLAEPGVVCTNPDADPARRAYLKRFARKRVYLPGEYDRAVSEVLHGTDVIVLGMNGYSSIKPEHLAAWGIKEGAYEAACRSLVTQAVQRLQREFPGVDVRFAHGASNMGVDRAMIDVSYNLNRPQLGHSCPHFLFYVQDDDVPVYVAPSQPEYAAAFTRSLDVLLCANGRLQAFEMDIDAAFKFRKHVIPINVLRAISTTGGPPAFGPNNIVEDAVAAFEEQMHVTALRWNLAGCDVWAEMNERIGTTLAHIGRRVLSPHRAFGGH